MNREQTVHKFFSSFGIHAYDETTVPENAQLPYITYPVSIGKINSPVTIQPSIWYRGKSWEDITLKAMEITDGLDGHMISYDDGAILFFTGTPKYQRVDSGTDNVRRIVLTINMEFLER